MPAPIRRSWSSREFHSPRLPSARFDGSRLQPVAHWHGNSKGIGLTVPPICPQTALSRSTASIGSRSASVGTRRRCRRCRLTPRIVSTSAFGRSKRRGARAATGDGLGSRRRRCRRLGHAWIDRRRRSSRERGAVVVMIAVSTRRISGFSRTPLLTCGVATSCLGQLRFARSDRRAAVGAAQCLGLRQAIRARVTIFGQSAGAVDVVCLMISPLSRGLFHRVVAQSGSLHWPDSRAPAAGDRLHPVRARRGRAVKNWRRNLGVGARAERTRGSMRAASAD